MTIQFKNCFALFVAASLLTTASVYGASVDLVTIDDKGVFPESITSTKAGDLIIGSLAKGVVYRAKAGAKDATAWLDPAKTGMAAVLGVYADDASNTLYVCSISPFGGTPQPKLSALRTFDLATGAAKATYPMPNAEKSLCNDIAVDSDGSAYITDTSGAQILKLKKGAASLDVWLKDDRFAGADGVALGKGVVYINTVTTGRLFSIAKGAGGAAGSVVELQPSMKLSSPDGMRSLGGNKFLLAENSATDGRVSEVTVNADKAVLRVLKQSPGATAITLVGRMVWVNDAKLPYLIGPMKGKPAEPFTEFAIPLH